MDLADAPQLNAIQYAVLDGLLQQSHMAVGVCDARGVLIMMSPAMQELLGVDYSPVPHSDWAETYFLHDEYGEPLPAGQDPLARAMRGESVTNEVVSVRRPDRPARWAVVSGITLLDARQSTVGAAVFMLDITTSKVERARLDDLRNRLVETVNHEVRTPLATIVGHVELMEDQGLEALPEWARRPLGAISRASRRLNAVVDTISDLADQSQRGPRRRH